MNLLTMSRPVAALLGALLLGTRPAFAAQPETAPPERDHSAMPMPDGMAGHSMGSSPQLPTSAKPTDMKMDMGSMPDPDAPMEKMDMGSMQGGSAPPDARDPDAYAEGFVYTGMPGMEEADQIVFGKLLADELEFLSGNEGEGFNWSVEGNYGDDKNKVWLRTQGQKIPGQPIDPTTDGEVLWWHPYTAFWGTQLGLRQDFGPGAHHYLAAGIEGLAPYWFDVEATGYVGEDGRLSARCKAFYDLRFTNRLILAPSIEANVYSRSEDQRGLDAGLGNLEGGLRLRYEVHRKFAPYIGYVWERFFAGTADLRRAEDEPVSERRFVAGLRLWW
jgi:copper resistance protein B